MNIIKEFDKSIKLTDSACNRIQNVLKNNKDNGSRFRVYVTGGGCSGFQYGFSFDEKSAAEDDTPVEKLDVTVLVDALSIQYLAGSTVDYRVDLMGSRFTITNPNAVTTCGCGASFSL